MKRFLIIVVGAGIIAAGLLIAMLNFGFYFDFQPDAPVSADFSCEGSRIIAVSEDGREEVRIKGVEVSASIPEHAASDFKPEKEDYMRWFRQIREMGANTVKVAGIMDDTFYEAFYDFNVNSDSPLYLIQGILVQDAVNYGAGDAYESDYMGELLADGKRIVDIIHGRRIIMNREPGRGTGWYKKDISGWVIGFLVGSSWNADVVAYTDHETYRNGVYEGEYFSTKPGASPFEAMLAQVMDTITAYESNKYKEQHMIGFANEPATDLLEYRHDYGELMRPYEKSGKQGVTYARQLNKICRIDAENIGTSEKVQAGYFAAYSLYDFCADFDQYLSEEQSAEFADILSDLDRDGSYDGYTEFLGRYHTIPLICTSYGFSTARGVVSEKGFPLTETEQGERLVAIYEDLCKEGWSGAVINSWQDRWELRSWNTAYAQDFTNNAMWHDLQTESQWYGLMEFTGESRTIDGEPGEWEEEDVVYTGDGITLSAYVDTEGLALLAEGQNVTPNRTIYIPVDTTDQSGSTVCESLELSFSEPADFLICIDGEENSRVLVQERYESVRANFLSEINGEDAYVSYPDADSSDFIPINMVMENTTMVDYVDYTTRELKYLPLYETGKLRHGNGDPSSADYDSLSDFCYGENCVEIRLPWALLNFANPVSMNIHDDYYENYGVEFTEVEECRIGISYDGTEKIRMDVFPLNWENRTYSERLKDSYRIVQAAWR